MEAKKLEQYGVSDLKRPCAEPKLTASCELLVKAEVDFKPESPYYTYKDYARWETGDERFELIDGVPLAMASPTGRHQDILLKLGRRFGDHLEGKRCRVRIAPFDVRLNFSKADDTVLQPDVIVVCDPEKLADDRFCKGAPDIVIEILSPSTQKRDRTVKKEKYREAGVAELWYVDYLNEVTEINKLIDNKCEQFLYFNDDKITTDVLPEFELDVAGVFVV